MDTIYGGDGDDDIIGGHNVAGGLDSDDRLDGGAGNDVIAGDNAFICRRSRWSVPADTGTERGSPLRRQPERRTGRRGVNNWRLAQVYPDGVVQRDVTLLDPRLRYEFLTVWQ